MRAYTSEKSIRTHVKHVRWLVTCGASSWENEDRWRARWGGGSNLPNQRGGWEYWLFIRMTKKGELSLRGVAVTTETATTAETAKTVKTVPRSSLGTVFCRTSEKRTRCFQEQSKPPKPPWKLPPLNPTPLFRHPDFRAPWNRTVSAKIL